MSSCHGPGQQSDPPTNSRRDVSPGQKVKPPVPWDRKAAYDYPVSSKTQSSALAPSLFIRRSYRAKRNIAGVLPRILMRHLCMSLNIGRCPWNPNKYQLLGKNLLFNYWPIPSAPSVCLDFLTVGFLP